MKLYSWIFLLLFIGGCTGARNVTVSSSAAGIGTPDRIMLNPLESGEKGVAVTWRTPLGVDDSIVQWRSAQPHPIVASTELNMTEGVARVDTVEYEGSSSIFKSYRAKLTDLEPDNTYMYRVGDGGTGWSEWLHFTLPSEDPDSPFTFIYLGDPQNDLFSQWSRTIRQAYAAVPEASFILYAGDLVNRGYNDLEWDEWYRAGDFIHRMIPSIMTPGNHEYSYPDITPLWKSLFTFPSNGPEGYPDLDGAAYYIDYPAVRVISLDGTTSEHDDRLRRVQSEWLEEVLKENNKKWTILTLHQPFYSTSATRDNAQIRGSFQHLLDEYGVDIVLQGHDHAYGRGMLEAGAEEPGSSGTMYVVSVSGPKMYEVGDEKNWIQVQLERTQLYQVITIDGDQLSYASYTIAGELFDEFTLTKDSENRAVLE